MQIISQLLGHPEQLMLDVSKSSSTMSNEKLISGSFLERIATPKAPRRCPFSSVIIFSFNIFSKAFTTPIFLDTPP